MAKDMRQPFESAAIPIINDRAQIDAVREQLVDILERFGYGKSSAFAIRLAVEEALNNAFTHGHRDLPSDEPVTIQYHVCPDEVRIVVADGGPGFDPDAIPDPTLDENLEIPSGRGLLLMRAYMRSVEFNAVGNVVQMVYRRPPDDASDP